MKVKNADGEQRVARRQQTAAEGDGRVSQQSPRSNGSWPRTGEWVGEWHGRGRAGRAGTVCGHEWVPGGGGSGGRAQPELRELWGTGGWGIRKKTPKLNQVKII